jgi:hypothetical protein
MQNISHSPGTITLLGSGEMSATMGKVHRAVMARIAEPVRAVFLDTPAGFQLNADQISAKAVDYFKQRFNLALSVVSFKAATTVTPVEIENALRKLRLANYIFAGPGSPTYTARNWQDTAILGAITQRLATGAHLVLASAAAIAVGRYALPVYEIYKVGEEPHWVDGLDLLAPYGLELAIVPHWNNTEGATHDTRYCFMGEPRLKRLETYLPDSTTILGIDEYTACIMDLDTRECLVMGAGQVTIRHGGRERYYPAGAAFALDQLRRVSPTSKQDDSLQAGASPELTEGMGYKLSADWSDWPDALGDDAADAAPFIDLIVWIRAQLRAARQWALADEIRQRLSGLGIILEDGPTETAWRKV